MRSLAAAILLTLTGIIHAAAEIDSAGTVIISRITLEGNRLTRSRIILRELMFSQGDTVEAGQLPRILKQSRDNVFNTSLFNIVEIDTVMQPSSQASIEVVVRVIERWYIWPIPYIEFPNRNINAWIETFDFRRLTYGVNFKFFNARGRDETLTLLLHFGFNQEYGFTYQTPYLDRKQTAGFGLGGGYDRNKSVITSTTGNKSDYLDYPEAALQERAYGFIEGYFRPNLYSYHTISVGYDHYHFADTLLKIPGYITDSAPRQSFFTLYYKYKLDHRDVRYYPLRGFYFDLELAKQGFFSSPVDMFTVQSAFRKYWRFSDRWYLAAGATLKWSWPYEQPFFLQQGIGYGRDIIRGFEYYSVNGPWFAILKTNVKLALVRPRVLNIPFIRSSKFGIVPFGIYLNIFADAGFAGNPAEWQEPENPLENTLLAGYGVSFDLVTYYDIVIDLNFALNSLGEPGVYIHFIAPI